MMRVKGLAGVVAKFGHYAWAVAALCFFVLLAAAGARSASSVLILPLAHAFGWITAIVSSAIAVNLMLFGALGPFTAAWFERFGVTRMVIGALILIACGVGGTFAMTEPWQFLLLWGILVGIGSGVISPALAATITNRWFHKRRGLAMGILTASSATGQMVFLPALSSLEADYGWKAVPGPIAVISILLIPLVLVVMRERPADVGLRPYGALADEQTRNSINPQSNSLAPAFQALGRGLRSREFWILFASFTVCGLSTNGLIGTHFIPTCVDHHIASMEAARMLAFIAVFDLFGTILSGWMSDRWDNRYLLFWYYALRGLALFYLPYAFDSTFGLGVFVIFYGLNWIATVPPTAKLLASLFGPEDGTILFGWLLVGHQLGAGIAAGGAGIARTVLERYFEVYLLVALLCMVAAISVLFVRSKLRSAQYPLRCDNL
ncbi:MAG: MFS transporter [Methylococcales bacterium]